MSTDTLNFIMENWDTITAGILFIGTLVLGKAKVFAIKQLLHTISEAWEDKHITPEERKAIKEDIDKVLGRKK